MGDGADDHLDRLHMDDEFWDDFLGDWWERSKEEADAAAQDDFQDV